MAQYIGVEGVSRAVKAGYIGVSGVARKVKSGYIGVSGVARQFFALPTWKKYNVTKSLDAVNKVTQGYPVINWQETSTWYCDRNNTGFKLTWDIDANLNISNVRFSDYSGSYYTVTTETSDSGTTTSLRGFTSSPVYRLFGADSYTARYGDDGLVGYTYNGKSINNSTYVIYQGITSNYKSSYATIYKRNFNQGSYISDVTAPEGTYPDNGIHSDGYWYVKQ